jgi:hypothetical protein
MKIATPTQMNNTARMEQPIAKTLPVPTVDSSVPAGGVSVVASATCGAIGSGLAVSGSDKAGYPAPFQRQAPSSKVKA